MDISKLTRGQKRALLESLTSQKSPKTTGETETLSQLRDDLAEEVSVSPYGFGVFKRVGNFIKQIELDTFGERYNNCWVKIYENTKGEYFTMSYFGNKRMYLS